MQLNDRFYKSPEVAKILGVSLRTLYRYMESGKIKSIRLPSGRHRFTKEQIEEFLYANNDVPLEMPAKPNNINVGQTPQTQSAPTTQTSTQEEVSVEQNVSQAQESSEKVEEETVKEEPQASPTYQPFAETKEEPEQTQTTEEVKDTVEESKGETASEKEEKQQDSDMDLEAELERLLASLEEDEEEETPDTQDTQEKSKEAETTAEPSILGFEEEKEEVSKTEDSSINENEVMYFYCPYNELRRIARIIEKTAADAGKEYAFTLNAGLSLFFPLDPFSIIHFYINEKDLDFWKESLQLKESSKEDANIGILRTKGSAFDNVREVSGLKVVNKERLIENLKANGLENLVEEAEEKL